MSISNIQPSDWFHRNTHGSDPHKQWRCEDLVAWFAENKALSPTLQEVVR